MRWKGDKLENGYMRRVDMSRYFLIVRLSSVFLFGFPEKKCIVFESSDYDTLIVRLPCGFCFLKRYLCR